MKHKLFGKSVVAQNIYVVTKESTALSWQYNKHPIPYCFLCTMRHFTAKVDSNSKSSVYMSGIVMLTLAYVPVARQRRKGGLSQRREADSTTDSPLPPPPTPLLEPLTLSILFLFQSHVLKHQNNSNEENFSHLPFIIPFKTRR